MPTMVIMRECFNPHDGWSGVNGVVNDFVGARRGKNSCTINIAMWLECFAFINSFLLLLNRIKRSNAK